MAAMMRLSSILNKSKINSNLMEIYMIFETERTKVRNLNEDDIEKMVCYELVKVFL